MGGATISSQKVRRETQGGKNQVFSPSLPKMTCLYVLEQVSLVPAFQSTMPRLITGCSSLQATLTLEQMLVDAHKKDLQKFDRDRALPAWDSLLSQQQVKLQQLQVPAMHITSESAKREVRIPIPPFISLKSSF